MKLYLVRHGESLGNVDETLYKEIPDHKIGLTLNGERQVKSLAKNLAKELKGKKHKVIVSPFLRAKMTADILIEKGLKTKAKHVIEEPLVVEQRIHTSYKSMKEFQEPYASPVKKDFGFFWYKDSTSESEHEAYIRARLFLNEVRSGYYGKKPLVVVTHGVFIKILCSIIDKVPVDQYPSEHIANATCILKEV